VPGKFRYHADRQAVGRIGTSKAILDKDVLVLEMRHHPLFDTVEALGIDRPVDIAPPDIPLG
jgi:hypothetical protein